MEFYARNPTGASAPGDTPARGHAPERENPETLVTVEANAEPDAATALPRTNPIKPMDALDNAVAVVKPALGIATGNVSAQLATEAAASQAKTKPLENILRVGLPSGIGIVGFAMSKKAFWKNVSTGAMLHGINNFVSIAMLAFQARSGSVSGLGRYTGNYEGYLGPGERLGDPTAAQQRPARLPSQALAGAAELQGADETIDSPYI